MPLALIISSHVAASHVGGAAQAGALSILRIDAMVAPTVLYGRHPGWGPPGGAKVEPASIFAKRTNQPKAKSKAARSANAAADKPAPNASDIAHWREVFGTKEKDP